MANKENCGAFDANGASKYIGISLPKLYELIYSTDFPAFRVGRRWVIPKDALDAWLARQAQERAQL